MRLRARSTRSVGLGLARPRAGEAGEPGRSYALNRRLDAAEHRALERGRGDDLGPTLRRVRRLGRIFLVTDLAPDALEDRAGDQAADHADDQAERLVEKLRHRSELPGAARVTPRCGF